MRNKILILFLFFVITIFLIGCQTQQPVYNQPPQQGRVVFAITDKAVDLSSVSSIKIMVDNVSVHNSADGWITIPFTPTTYDLIALKNSDAPLKLAEIQLKEGAYQQVRLGISKVIVTDATGDHEARLPSGELKIIGNLEVQRGSTAAVTFDFIADESLHVTGNSIYVFAPVVRLEIRKNVIVNPLAGDKMVDIYLGEVKTNVKVGMNENGEVGEDKIITKDKTLTLESGKILVGVRGLPQPPENNQITGGIVIRS